MNEQINKTRMNNEKVFVRSVEDDPRIDSPEIKVVYPSITHGLPQYEIVEPTTPPEPPKEEDKEKEVDEHECKVGWLDALKQNGTPFLLIALALLGIGIIIGKK